MTRIKRPTCLIVPSQIAPAIARIRQAPSAHELSHGASIILPMPSFDVPKAIGLIREVLRAYRAVRTLQLVYALYMGVKGALHHKAFVAILARNCHLLIQLVRFTVKKPVKIPLKS